MIHTLGQLLRAVFNRPLDGDLGAGCPYFRYQALGSPMGTCKNGCSEEPRCLTNEPRGGWPVTRGLPGRIWWVLRGEGE